MDEAGKQRAWLEATIAMADTIRTELGELLASGRNVHFRPATKGFSMVGLLHDKPQLGKSGLTDGKKTAAEFERLFTEHCDNDVPGRGTPEKALQSFLIRDAYAHGRHMAALEVASARSNEPVELLFITDEIPLPFKETKIVCDVLALRTDGDVSTPVLIELKSDRQLERLVEQVEAYAPLIDFHADLFAKLFSATLGREVKFDGPTERWIVWPAAGWSPKAPESYDTTKLETADPREEILRTKHKIRTVAYLARDAAHAFRVGDR